MSYIIVWRQRTRAPFLDTDSHDFIEDYPTYEDALKSAKETYERENETKISEWYYDYKIYQEANN